MTERPAMNAIFLGGTRLVLECARVWRRYGLDVESIITDDRTIESDAYALGFPIEVVASASEFGERLHGRTTDYLFSVANQAILSDRDCSAARRLAINYHDGPLPRYAGLFAPSRAILRGETRHGVRWHVMTDHVDGGPVLAARDFDIDPETTAFELNGRCFQFAIEAFDELVGRIDRAALEESTDAAPPGERMYFGRRDRPPDAAIIDPYRRSAASIGRLVRALDFGRYDNGFAAPRLWIGDRFILARRAELRHAGAMGDPGMFLFTEDGEAIDLQTADGVVRLSRLSEIDGSPLVSVGEAERVPRLDDDEMAALDETERRAAVREPAHHALLIDANPCRMPGPPTETAADDEWRVESIVLDGFGGVEEGVTVIIGFLARLADEEMIDLALLDVDAASPGGAVDALFDRWKPLRVLVGFDSNHAALAQTVAAALDGAAEEPAMCRDLPARRIRIRESGQPAPGRWPTALRIGRGVAEAPPPADAGAEWVWSIDRDSERLGIACRSRSTLNRVAAQLRAYLSSVRVNATRPLARHSLLGPDDRRVALGATARPPDRFDHETLLIDRFEAIATASPDLVAVESDRSTVTYGELERRSNQLAHELRARGAERDAVVAIALDRSIERVVAQLAVWKAGAGYLPLAAEDPPARLRAAVSESSAQVLLSAARVEPPSFDDVETICLDRDSFDHHPDRPPERSGSPDDPAYVIYTSGSTGRPKGVLIEQRSLANNTMWMQDQFVLQPGDKLLHKTNFCFDVSLNETIWPLIAGATISLAPTNAEREPDRLVALVRERAITVIHFTPSMLRLFIEREGVDELSSLRLIMCGAEALSAPLRDRTLARLPHAEFVNFYGPTEAAVGVCSWHCRAGEGPGPPPLGFMISGGRLAVVDARGVAVPVGATGEIWIGGVPLARGYLDRPEETAAAFAVKRVTEEDEAQRWYRTGDLGRWRSDGALEYIGRRDEQSKVRGYRVELGEIEAALSAAPEVRRAAARVRDGGSEIALIEGFVEADDDQKTLDAEVIFDQLDERLPAWMRPSNLYQIASVPLLPSGKVNRVALESAPARRLERRRTVEPPGDALEAALLRLWRRLLPGRAIGVNDSFFDIGGHSLLGLRLIDDIHRELEVDLPVSSLFEAPTIRALAARVRQSSESEPATEDTDWQALVPIRATGDRPPIFLVHPIEGTVLDFADLARSLGDDQPVYAFQSPWLDRASGDPLSTVESLAEHDLRLLRRVQPSGPYAIVGRCFGGLIAYEMARRLVEAGERISLLALLDCYRAPTPATAGAEAAAARGRGGHLLSLAETNGDARRPGAFRRATMKWKRLHRRLHERIESRRLSPRERRARRIWRANDLARRRYQPGPYTGPITLALTDDFTWIPEYIATRLPSAPEELPGRIADYWRGLTTGEVELVLVPGTHQSALREPHVATLAARLRERLEADEPAK